MRLEYVTMTTLFLILIAVVILANIWLNAVSSRIGIPALLAFMVLGMLFANNGLWQVRFDNYDFAKETCTVGLIFIMFYGGFGTRWKAVKPVVRESALLASAGVVVTAALVGVFCHFALRWTWLESMLFGSVMSSTDAASVFSILRSRRLGLKNNAAPMLEMESGSNDPAAYTLTTILLSVMNGTSSAGMVAWNIFAQIAFGAGCGLLIAKLAALGLRKIDFGSDASGSLFIFAVAVASYAVPSLIGGNGYLSAYIVGIILGNEEFSRKKSTVSFFDGITGLAQMLIFFLLGLLARPAARPAAVFGILAPFRKYSVRMQTLVSFVGLRGVASIVFAIMAMVDPAFLHNDIFNIVFMVVLLSITIQGSLIPLVAKKLDMVDPHADVMKTFSDYSDDSGMSFGRISVTADSTWAGKAIRDLGLPRAALLVLVLRGDEKIQPGGSTVLLPGDEVIMLTRGFEDSVTSLKERTIKADSRFAGKPLSEFHDKGLVVLVRRGEQNIIPNGGTVLESGDRLVILNLM